MSFRKPLSIRKALLAGVVALALTGTGAALTWAASDEPSGTPSESAQGQGKNKADKAAKAGKGPKADKANRPQELHSESVVKKSDGTFETQVSQRGTVEAVTDSSVTVKSEDGFSQSYAVNAETRIIKIPAPAADGSPAKGPDGKRLRPSDVPISEIAVGETIRVSGVRAGSDVTAKQVVEGAGAGPGNGLGLGRGQGRGLDKGASPSK
ncbi:hypothetical protein F8G81_07335 [Arthrobacter sp. CDRTa11]|uniref:hypothetical protein n=1 Tax=Arthrobacter sp. CDRTa11 TaxID=2651199 RepID=UPI002265EAD1|nr:hypothetical protein [Arthrobacter sp. CDRTa11]UZX02451.1 hypothetical protein F8G81_07335 [Arthrobacter sp. CDRTa11]